ncbi:hypothetical protein ACROYT_G041555 [Oculina patagonica]
MYHVQVQRYVALSSIVFLSLLAISLFHLGQVLGVDDIPNNCFYNPIGVADQSTIPDNQMTASSRYGNNYQAAYGRLHGDRGDGWCAKEPNRTDDWLQVDLRKVFQVCGVATQGDRNHDDNHEWVTDFKLSFSPDGSTWTTYKDGNGAEMEFQREGDSDTVDQHKLPMAESARYIRFYPTQQHRWNCLRVEVYGTTDIDECLANTHDCDSLATCTNTDGSFTCACNVGYTGNGKSCSDVDECTANTHDCDLSATCTNTDGSFTCACDAGYTGDGKSCSDVDECTANTHDCDLSATCTNTDGSLTCVCHAGYTGDGKSCSDIDECAANTHDCDLLATCTNTDGSFTCACNEGYTGDGKSCSEQCRQLVFGAEQTFEGKRLINHVIRVHDVMMAPFCDALCYMEDNCTSYNLMRRSEAEGYKCELNNSTHEGNENDLEEDPNYDYRGTKSACVSNPCKNKATCQTGFTDKGYRCLCTPGFQGQQCQYDIDECASGTDDCSADAVCNNTKGSYNCSCKSGYYGDGRICEDTDECASGTHDCSADAVCNNTKGSYNCSCKPGYSGDGLNCEDIDECASETHDCSADAVCNNNKGSYNCSCKSGYYGDGRNCEDIDECASGTHDCSADAVCNNTKGSYNCSCKPGYYGDGRICEVLQCKELYERNLTNERNPYCGLGACGFEHWTLVMKIDGSKDTFRYHSDLWSNNETFYLAGGETGLDTQETKLTSYWDTSFSKICLGMRIHGEENTNFLAIDKTADSLYSLIADGVHRSTSLGRDTWKTLIGSQASLQSNCNMEGFNARCYWDASSRARIGFVANNDDDCWTCDSRIGFGTGGFPDESNTCGNVAKILADNGEKYLYAMCYVFVR